jgi:hypothetical protein
MCPSFATDLSAAGMEDESSMKWHFSSSNTFPLIRKSKFFLFATVCAPSSPLFSDQLHQKVIGMW